MVAMKKTNRKVIFGILVVFTFLGIMGYMVTSCQTVKQDASSISFEFEDADISGNTISIENSIPKYSGRGYLMLRNANESVSFTFDSPEDAYYNIKIRYYLPHDFGVSKTQNFVVNQSRVCSVVFTANSEFSDMQIGLFHLKKGKNTITLVSQWGWVMLDSITLIPAEKPAPIKFNLTKQLCDSKALPVTQRVYDYLCDEFRRGMLSGQQEGYSHQASSMEIDYIYQNTGKYPAIRGLDFMNNDFDHVVKNAKDWWMRGGLVTICWHTGIYGKGYTESLNDSPDFRKLLDINTSEHQKMIANWDCAAEALMELQKLGVVVLWRPFHEFDGKWFWWGKGTPEDFVALWRMMYQRFTEKFQLHNLIWVLGFSGNVDKKWYVGDDFCDIIGSDTYDGTCHKDGWDKLALISLKKPMAFHECGKLPSILDFKETDSLWSWFMIWHTEWIMNNSLENLREYYKSDMIITLDELPNFRLEK